jgi:hypothetical protein
MDSYAISSLIIYILSAWITLGFIDMEDNTQQQLTVLHSRNQTVYYLCKIAFLWIFMMILNIIVILYPVVRHLFVRKVTGTDLWIAIAIHAILSLLGISIALLFNSRLLPDRRTGLLCLFGFVLISIIQTGIIREIPILKYIVYLFPPVSFVMVKMEELSVMDLIKFTDTGGIALLLTILLCYSVLLIFLFIKLMKKKAF